MKKKFAYGLCSCLTISLSGCGDNAPRNVTDGVDMDAIRAYEKSIADMNKQDNQEMEAEKKARKTE